MESRFFGGHRATMRAMRMKTMAELYHQSVTANLYNDLTTDEFIAMLVDSEWEERNFIKNAENLIITGPAESAKAIWGRLSVSCTWQPAQSSVPSCRTAIGIP